MGRGVRGEQSMFWAGELLDELLSGAIIGFSGVLGVASQVGLHKGPPVFELYLH
jgi:hypothetical protein